MDFRYLFTSPQGRINRKPYWLATLVLVIAVIVVSFLAGILYVVSVPLGAITSLLVGLGALYFSYFLIVKRLADRNRPPVLALVALAPSALVTLAQTVRVIGSGMNSTPGTLEMVLGVVMVVVGLWFLVELGFLRGTRGPNQYGPDPLDPHGAQAAPGTSAPSSGGWNT
jgi:uncharacterized membrane protein YhaH (DUF805 family)